MTPPVAVAPRKEPLHVECDYCHEDAELVDKSEVYLRAFGGKVWLCKPCRAWVLAHRDAPYRPMGRLAKSWLRAKKLKAYCLFDRIWRMAAEVNDWPEPRARSTAYRWLANEMGLDPRDCDIGRFDDAATQIVIDICMAVGAKKDVAA